MTGTRDLRRQAAMIRAKLDTEPGRVAYLWAPDGVRGAALQAWMEEQRVAAGADRAVAYRWADNAQEARAAGWVH